MQVPSQPYASPPRHPAALTLWRRRIQPFYRACFELIFPRCCARCGRADTAWCPRCAAILDAQPLDRRVVTPPETHGIAAVAATGPHRGVLQNAIHALKYEDVPDLAGPLGLRLAATLRDLAWPVELLIPVPMHASKQAVRGYNQAALLSQSLAEAAGLAHDPSACRRDKYTRAQVGLSARERQHNVAEAFSALRERVDERAILLIDDVYTTGATLAACAAALREAGARVVYGLTVTTASDAGVAGMNLGGASAPAAPRAATTQAD